MPPATRLVVCTSLCVHVYGFSAGGAFHTVAVVLIVVTIILLGFMGCGAICCQLPTAMCIPCVGRQLMQPMHEVAAAD